MGAITSLEVVIVRPSNYDDDGYVVRYVRGVFPSNTLACMRSITLGFAERWKRDLGITITVKTYDELVEYIPFEKLAKKNRGAHKVVAAIAGVQTNQFARASDIAKKLVDLGIKTLIGGFHVSGILAMFGEPTAELKELTDIGVTLVGGEAEDVWEPILFDVISGKEQMLYRAQAYPDISHSPVPEPDAHAKKKIAVSNMGTIDCSRGCPFNCSFCTIINVQGKKMRCRDGATVIDAMRKAYDNGIKHYFLTDDNFSRNPNWRLVFEGLIQLREKEGKSVSFVMQVDTACDKIDGFVEMASRAGCTTVFIGMESINPDNIKAAGKMHNDVGHYASFIETWHKASVMCHIGYIIGFPFDTPESVRRDIEKLKSDVKPDLASFFILTPLPGSRDHFELVKSGAKMDSDLNRYDSFHVVTDHPRMSREDLYSTYQKAWDAFYNYENMKEILARARQHNYWQNSAFNFMWYKNSILEPRHPMVTGFVRMKKRYDVRPGTPVKNFLPFYTMKMSEAFHGVKKRVGLFFELQELWWLTRRSDDKTFQLLTDFSTSLNETKRKIATFDLNDSYARWCEEMSAAKASLYEKIATYYNTSDLKGKSRKKWNRLIEDMRCQMDKTSIADYYNRQVSTLTSYLSRTVSQAEETTLKRVRQRRSMTEFWSVTWDRLKRGRIISLTLSSPKIVVSAIRDTRMSLTFTYHFFLHKTELH